MGGTFFDGLEAELVNAARSDLKRRHRRVRHRWLLAAFVAGTILVVGIMQGSSASAGIDITRAGTDIVVRLTQLESDPGGIERALRDAGVDATVSAVPAAPSRVGRFVALAEADDPSAAVEYIDPIDGSSSAISIPEGASNPIRLFVGRQAWPWERYDAPGNAYQPGEPLYCSNVWGLQVADAKDVLDRLGIRIRWEMVTLTYGAQRVDDPATIADWFVTDAQSVGPREVVISVTTTGESLYNTSPPPPCD